MSYPKHYDLSGPSDAAKKAQENRSVGSSRQPHHIALMEAIGTIEILQQALIDLHKKIFDPSDGSEAGPNKTGFGALSLSWVLANSSDIIRTRVADCLCLIEEIRGALF